MKHTIAAALAALLVACAGGAHNGSANLAMSTVFAPDPPKRGSEAITIALKNSDGSPVNGARVKIATTMPSMSMSGPDAIAKDNGNGTYTATIVLQYATDWTFAVTATKNGETATSEIKQTVK